MDAASLDRTRRAAWLGPALLSVLGLLAYAGVAVARMSYRYELEWFEGTSVELVRRILAGQPIYAPASIDFIPHLYAPLYFYAGAALASVLGVDFFPLRLLSFASSLVCFAEIYALARREGGTRATGLVAAGLFAACFRFSGAWYDLARVDSLSLALLLGAILVVRVRPTAGWIVLAGGLGVLSFFTKQNALPVIAALSVYLAWSTRGAARLLLPAVVAAGVMAGNVLFDQLSDGWFRYYVWKIPGQGSLPHHIRWLLMFWLGDVPVVLPAFVASLAWMKHLLDRGALDDLAFFAAMLGAAIFCSWSARIHAGGYDNALIALDAWIAIGGALGFQTLARAERPAVVATATAAAILQFVLLRYDPFAQIPAAGDAELGDRAVARLRELPGDVLVVYHPYLGVLAGKPAHGHLDLVNTIPRGTEARIRLDRQIDDAIHQRRYAAIVYDRRIDRGYRRKLRPDLDAYYEYRGSLVDGAGPRPVTGLVTWPQDLYVRRELPADATVR